LREIALDMEFDTRMAFLVECIIWKCHYINRASTRCATFLPPEMQPRLAELRPKKSNQNEGPDSTAQIEPEEKPFPQCKSQWPFHSWADPVRSQPVHPFHFPHFLAYHTKSNPKTPIPKGAVQKNESGYHLISSLVDRGGSYKNQERDEVLISCRERREIGLCDVDV
jgi:hypothetical protein